MGFAPGWPLAPDVSYWRGVALRAASASPSEAFCFRSFDLHAPARPFTAAQRLRHKSDFDRVYSHARRCVDALFAVFACATGAATPRLGLSIAGKVVGNAVRRNRIKRLIRESFRQHQHELPAVDIVVNARAGARNATNAAISESLEQHWLAVSRQCAPSSKH